MPQVEDTFYALVFDHDKDSSSVLNELLKRLRKLKKTKAEVYRSELRDAKFYLNHPAFIQCTGMPELPKWRWTYNRKQLDAPLMRPLVQLFPEQK